MGARYLESRHLCVRPARRRPVALFEQLLDGGFFPDDGAFVAGVLHQHLVKLGAQDLPRLSNILIVTIEKIEWLRSLAGGRDKLDAVFFDEGRLAHLLDQTEALQRIIGERQE